MGLQGFLEKRVRVGCREVLVASVCVLGVEVVWYVSGEELLPGHPSRGRQRPLGGQSARVCSLVSQDTAQVAPLPGRLLQHPG